MGTRGLWGYVIDGEEKLTYNHFDSYPSELGTTVLDHLRHYIPQGRSSGAVNRGIDELRDSARVLILVREDDKPTPEQIEQLGRFHDPQVSSGSPQEWYSLLRLTQGYPDIQLDAGVMIDSAGFAGDSLFCEWAYVIDLDNEMLEVYRGFVKSPHTDGRFSDRPHDGPSTSGETYYPIKQVASWSLRELPSNEEFQRTLEREEVDA
jgi:hypothetical protein